MIHPYRAKELADMAAKVAELAARGEAGQEQILWLAIALKELLEHVAEEEEYRRIRG